VHLTVLDHAIAIEFCVRLLVKRLHPDKTKESSAYILIPYERLIRLVLWLWHEDWLWVTLPSTWNFGPNWPRSS